jgi:hypothetical protein
MRLSPVRVSASAAAAIAIATALLLACAPREFDRAVRMARGGAQRLDAVDSAHGHDLEHSEQTSAGATSATGRRQGLDSPDPKAPVDLSFSTAFPVPAGLVRTAQPSSNPLGRPAVPATGRAPPLT